MAPSQTVVAGPHQAIVKVLERAEARQVPGRLLPVACAFHTPLMEPRASRWRSMRRRRSPARSRAPYSRISMRRPIRPIPGAIADRLGEHVTSPVRFAEMIVAMHDQGARVFVEVGPGGVLTPLVGSILGDRPHLAVACDVAGRPSLAGLLHALARLAAAGLPVRLGTAHTRSGTSGSWISKPFPRATARLHSAPRPGWSMAAALGRWMPPSPAGWARPRRHQVSESQAARPQPRDRGTETPSYNT